MMMICEELKESSWRKILPFQKEMIIYCRKLLVCAFLLSSTVITFLYYGGRGEMNIRTIFKIFTNNLTIMDNCTMIKSFMIINNLTSKSPYLSYSRKLYNIRMRTPNFEPHNIFFLETSGANNLSVRQACAIESTARYHPESEIRVLMFTSRPFQDTHNLTGIFHNVYVNVTTFENIFEDTPLLRWYRNKEWNGSSYRIHHLSDASRLAVIWKYGGVYLDLDFVMLTSLSEFWHRNMTNFLIKENSNSLCNSIFGFNRRHPFLRECMLSVFEKYRSDCWACIGPWLITDQFNSYCPGLKLEDKGTSLYCNVTILPVISAFPLPYYNWKELFTKKSIKNIFDKIKESYMIHLWNVATSKEMLQPGIDTAYGKIMSVHCPHVYKYAIEVGVPF